MRTSPSRAASPRGWTRPARGDPLAAVPPAGSSRFTAALARVTQPLRRTAAGHRGNRRRGRLDARPAGQGRGAAARGGRASHGERSARRPAATLAAGGKRLRPLLVLIGAGAEEGERGGPGGRSRSSWSTWRRWSTTTCSPRPGARGHPTVVAARAGARARRHRQPLLSRAFAVLAASRGDARSIELLAAAWITPRPRRARPAPGRLRHRGLRAALPRALPAEDRDALPLRGPARPRATGRWRGSRGFRIGLAFQLLDDVLDVFRAPRATARHAAPTCSTARSPCR